MIFILVLSNIYICIYVEIKVNWLNMKIMFVVWLFLIVYNVKSDYIILRYLGLEMFVLLFYLYCDFSFVMCVYLCYDIGINICVVKFEVYVFWFDLKCFWKMLKKSGYDDMDRLDLGEKR